MCFFKKCFLDLFWLLKQFSLGAFCSVSLYWEKNKVEEEAFVTWPWKTWVQRLPGKRLLCRSRHRWRMATRMRRGLVAVVPFSCTGFQHLFNNNVPNAHRHYCQKHRTSNFFDIKFLTLFNLKWTIRWNLMSHTHLLAIIRPHCNFQC